MSADADGDSQMASSYEFSDAENELTPPRHSSAAPSNTGLARDAAASSILTPPPRGHGIGNSSSSSSSTSAAAAAAAAAFANANGKRPLNTISNGHEDDDDDDGASGAAGPAASGTGGLLGGDSGDAELAAGKPPPEFAPRTHAGSGYSWTRAEDEPGAAWLGKRAVDELHRAVESQVHKEFVVLGRYGDPFEAADRERAVAESLTQR